jgi:hypothetical protein
LPTKYKPKLRAADAAMKIITPKIDIFDKNGYTQILAWYAIQNSQPM